MRNVLIVDDNVDIVEALNIILIIEGFSVSSVFSGVHLMDVVVRLKPDLILLDIMLNGFDGRELCYDLKSSALTSNIPIILFSAAHTLLNCSKALYKPDDILTKPFDIDELVGKLKNLTC